MAYGGRALSWRQLEEEMAAEQAPDTDWSGWRLDLPLLPPNVLVAISELLEVRDGLRCMTVCRSWFELFRYGAAFEPFWRRTYLYMGLTAAYIQEHISRFEFPSDMYAEIVRHRNHVKSSNPEIKFLAGNHPFDSSTKCEHAGGGYFVKTVDFSSMENQETVIGQLCPERREIMKLDTLVGTYGEVEWASMCAKNIVWHTGKNVWFRYSLQNAMFHKLFPHIRIMRSMSDCVGHCKNCLFFVVAAAENASHGYNWNIQLVKVEGEGGEDASTLEYQCKLPIPPDGAQFVPKPVVVYITSTDGCASHRLFVQGGSGTCVYGITHTSLEITLTKEPLETLNPFYDTGVAIMVANTTSTIQLSEDERLGAMVTSLVYPFTTGLMLHVFDLDSYKRIIKVKVNWTETFNNAEILVFSRLYTVLGVQHSRGIVKILQTCTGRVLFERLEITSGLPPVIPMARLLFCHYQGVYGEDSLCDIFAPLTLAILYRKGVGNIQGLFFDPVPKPPDSEKPALEEQGDSEDADWEN